MHNTIGALEEDCKGSASTLCSRLLKDGNDQDGMHVLGEQAEESKGAKVREKMIVDTEQRTKRIYTVIMYLRKTE
jgi:hypothetical protein